MPEPTLHGLDELEIPARIRSDLGTFIRQVLTLSAREPLSVTAFGSAVTSDYSEKASDLNLLVVYPELGLEDLRDVAPVARKWLRRRGFSPRFLSLQNLTETARYFQIDLLGMRDARVVIYGEDVLEPLEVSAPDLRWQLAHETKRMRMRLKQQYWRAAGDPRVLRAVLLDRTVSFLHLFRGLLHLEERPVPRSQADVARAAEKELDVNPDFFRHVSTWREGAVPRRTDELLAGMNELLAAVRALDRRVEQVKV